VAWDFIDMKPEFEAIAKQAKAVGYGSLAQPTQVSQNTTSSFVVERREGSGNGRIVTAG
jgi:hypothetical protein